MKKRLNAAGTASAVEVAGEAMQVAQSLDALETLRHRYEESLHNLGYYTHEAYAPSETALSDLSPEETTGIFPPDIAHAPETARFDAQIEAKGHEIQYLKRQNLPQVSLYSYYNLYGFDPDHWRSALQNFSHRTVQFGLNVNAPVFDGFKNKAAIRRAMLEREKLSVQKLKALAELQHRAEGFQQTLNTQAVLLETKAVILNRTQDKLTMDDRLSERQIVDKTKAMQDHIARIRQQLDAEQALIRRMAAAKKLKVLEAGF